MLQAFSGVIGIIGLLGLAYLMSNNKKAINWRLVISGLLIQISVAIFVLKVPIGQTIFYWIAAGISKILAFSDAGASFVFGPLVSQPETMNKLFGAGGSFIFAFKLIPTIIFVATLVSLAYHLGIMQRIIQAVAWVVAKVMGASGAEALSNVSSIFVGQVEAQLMVKPYVAVMTRSELLAVMAGSMACIAGGIMAVYIQMGIPAAYLLTASLMAAPGALVIAKLVYPETEVSQTQGEVKLVVEKKTVNLLDAAAHGASDGLRIGLQVCAMLIGFIALISMLDWVIGEGGRLLASSTGANLAFMGLDLQDLTLRGILGTMFSGVALALGVPWEDASAVGSLMGTKMVINEFVAYTDLTMLMQQASAEGSAIAALNPKSLVIATFALCGFANFSSIAIQIGGIGEIAPNRKADLARLGIMALICGTMASYISSAIAGIIISL
jgi:concentrative nucleoside transporter, CNT family